MCDNSASATAGSSGQPSPSVRNSSAWTAAPSSPLLFTASATAVLPSSSSPLLPSASPLARFRAGITAVTAANRIERLRGDAPSASTNPLYSDETLQQRAALVRHPAVQRELDILWGVAVAPRRQLHKAEYLTMHRKMVLALQPNTAPREAEQLAESDWARDAEGQPSLDRDRFAWTFFELADLYTPSLAGDDYAEFLRRLTAQITRGGDGGRTFEKLEWEDDEKVMRTHFNRRERAQADEPPGNYTFTECYSKWLVYWSRDTRAAKVAPKGFGSSTGRGLPPPRGMTSQLRKGAKPRRPAPLERVVRAAPRPQSSPEPSRAPPGGKQVVRLAPLPEAATSGAAVATPPPPAVPSVAPGPWPSTSPPDSPAADGHRLAAAILRRTITSPARPPPEPSATSPPPRPPPCRRRPAASRRRRAAPRPRRAAAATADVPPRAAPPRRLLSLRLEPATRRAGAVRRRRQPLAPSWPSARRLEPAAPRGAAEAWQGEGAAAAAGGRRGRRGAATPTADARCLDGLTGSAAAAAAAARAARRAARAASAQRPGRRPQLIATADGGLAFAQPAASTSSGALRWPAASESALPRVPKPRPLSSPRNMSAAHKMYTAQLNARLSTSLSSPDFRGRGSPRGRRAGRPRFG